jgi:hypothetical protein
VIPLRWEEIEALGLGRLERGATGDVVTGIRADSRVAGPGDLFVALNTGVRFVEDARGRGAATLVPDDQHAALAALAGGRRASAAAGGALLLAGSALDRWAVFKAGFQGAQDPKYVVEPQRARLRRRDALGGRVDG